MHRAAHTKQKTKGRMETAERGRETVREKDSEEQRGRVSAERERERAEWNKLKLIWCSAF